MKTDKNDQASHQMYLSDNWPDFMIYLWYKFKLYGGEIMWNIAICDDEPLAQQQLAALWQTKYFLQNLLSSHFLYIFFIKINSHEAFFLVQ